MHVRCTGCGAAVGGCPFESEGLHERLVATLGAQLPCAEEWQVLDLAEIVERRGHAGRVHTLTTALAESGIAVTLLSGSALDAGAAPSTHGRRDGTRRASRLPGVAVLAGYRREWLRGDLLAGVAVAAYLVPQVMAYSGIAGLPPQAGLWACLGSLAIYALLGSSRQLSVGPESTTALMTATAVAPLALGDPARHAALAAGLALVIGAICLVGGLLRAGSLADLLSQPVLVGYMAGHRRHHDRRPARARSPASRWRATRPWPRWRRSSPGSARRTCRPSRWRCPCSSASIVGTRLRPTWPVPMIGMLAATAVVAVFSLDDAGVRLVGSAVSGLPVPGLPALSATTSPRCCSRPSASRSSATRTTCSPPAPSRRAAGETIDGTTELVALGAAEPGRGRAARVPGEQQRQPHRDRRRPGQPHAAALAGRPRRWCSWC